MLIGEKMAWTSGALGKFDTIPNIEEKLKGFQDKKTIERPDLGTEEKFTLRSMIQLSPIERKLSDGTKVLQGTVFDEYVRKVRRVEERPNGELKVVETEPFVDTKWGGFYLTTESIIIAESSSTKDFTFKVVSRAMNGTDDHVQSVIMDIEEIAKDHHPHWLGSVKEREGHWQSGTLFGDDIESDDVVGDEYKKNQKGQIGIITEFFGAPMKVRITREGTIMVLGNLNKQIDRYIEYIRSELLGYAKIT